MTVLALIAGLSPGVVHGSEEIEAPQAPSPALWAAASEEMKEALEQSGVLGRYLYGATYINLVLAGESAQGPVALIAGSHGRNFPYAGTTPWDNGLLLVGDAAYHFTERATGAALGLRVSLDSDQSEGKIIYAGQMTRHGDRRSVAVEFEIPVSLVRQKRRLLGVPCRWLPDRKVAGLGETLGMTWQPFALSGASGRVQVEGQAAVSLREIHGELEHGVVTNLRHRKFAFSYDYVALARPGKDGYAFVDFVSHALSGETALGKLLDWFARSRASASLTLEAGRELRGNPHGVRRPAQTEDDVVLFENSVDLGLATLRRQMIRSKDGEGRSLYGLREIFVRTPSARR